MGTSNSQIRLKQNRMHQQDAVRLSKIKNCIAKGQNRLKRDLDRRNDQAAPVVLPDTREL